MLQLQTIDNIETHTGVIAFSHDSHSGHQCDIIMVAVNVQSSDEYWVSIQMIKSYYLRTFRTLLSNAKKELMRAIDWQVTKSNVQQYNFTQKSIKNTIIKHNFCSNIF